MGYRVIGNLWNRTERQIHSWRQRVAAEQDPAPDTAHMRLFGCRLAIDEKRTMVMPTAPQTVYRQLEKPRCHAGTF